MFKTIEPEVAGGFGEETKLDTSALLKSQISFSTK
jgi:hypothetical protein